MLRQSQHFARLLILGCLLLAFGCTGSKEWDMTAENKSDVPCSVTVMLGADGSGKTEIPNLTRGPAQTFQSGQPPTRIHSVKIVRNKEEQTLKPDVELRVGKRLAIVVGEDGKAEANLVDR